MPWKCFTTVEEKKGNIQPSKGKDGWLAQVNDKAKEDTKVGQHTFHSSSSQLEDGPPEAGTDLSLLIVPYFTQGSFI